MPALQADIFAASRDSVMASWSDTAIGTRYPNARDGWTQPSTGYFDAIADAQTVINARGALIGVERRRFAVSAWGLSWPTVSTGLPLGQLIDVEQSANSSFISARFELDLEAETTNNELFG